MSGVQSSLFWFPGPGARGSRLVGLWVTEMESCQGYHDGSLRCGWLAASYLNNATEQRMVVGVVPVETVRLSRCESRLQVVVGAHRLSRPPCCSGCWGGGCWCSLGCPMAAQTGRPRRGREVAGQRRLVGGRSTVQRVAKWEAGKANGPWREGCWSHTADRGLDHTQIGRVLGAGVPCREFATQMRVQAGAGRRGCTLVSAQLRVSLSGRCVVRCGVN